MSGEIILVVDTETTGTEDHDQMIQIAWCVVDGMGPLLKLDRAEFGRMAKSFKCKPTIEWHSEWHEKYNLTMDDVRDYSSLDSTMIQPFLDDIVNSDYLYAYNADFDIRLVECELRRLGIDTSIISKKPFIDPYVIWKKHEGQKLADAFKRWVGTNLDDAHDALADAFAAVAILPGMLAEFGLDNMTCKELAGLSREPDDVDRSGKMKWVDNKPVLTCTKYNYFGEETGKNVPGLNIWEVARYDQWYVNNYHGFKTVHRSVIVAFQLACRYIDDEQGFIDAMIEEFGAPPAEDDEVNVQSSSEVLIDDSMQQAIEQQRIENEFSRRLAKRLQNLDDKCSRGIEERRQELENDFHNRLYRTEQNIEKRMWTGELDADRGQEEIFQSRAEGNDWFEERLWEIIEEENAWLETEKRRVCEEENEWLKTEKRRAYEEGGV